MSPPPAILLMLVVSAGASITVEERTSPEGVFLVAEPKQTKLAEMASRVGGRQGWSFDMTEECQLVVVRARVSDGGDELLLLRPDAGKFTSETLLYFDPSGLASPVFSPDGRRLLVATGKDRIVEVELSSRRATDLGAGSVPMWDSSNRPILYRYDDGRRLHVLERFEKGKRLEIGRDERGINLAPIVGGSLPIGIPLPLVSGASEVAGMIGGEGSDANQAGRFAVTAAGVGCGTAVTYSDGEGGYVSILRRGSSWQVAATNACGLPTLAKAIIKRVSCRPANDARTQSK